MRLLPGVCHAIAASSFEFARLLTLTSPRRERAALAVARRVEHDSLYAVYMNDALPELVSRRLGCIVHQPEYAGVDLAALCLKDSAPPASTPKPSERVRRGG